MDGNNMEILEALQMFHKLNFSVLFQDMSKGEFITLKAIKGCSARCGTNENEFRTDDEGARAKVSDVVKHLDVMPSAVSRTLKTLEEKKWIIRTVNSRDRRNMQVELTEAGNKELDNVGRKMSEVTARILQKMDQKELEKMIQILHQLYEISKRELELYKEELGRKDV